MACLFLSANRPAVRVAEVDHLDFSRHWVFLFHVAVAMELVLLAPFMKLAHVIYRPVALFFYALGRAPDQPDLQGGTR